MVDPPLHKAPDEKRCVAATTETDAPRAADLMVNPDLLRFALDRAADGVSWLDLEGRFLYANEVECRRLGYSREELLSMTIFDIDPLVTPEILRVRHEQLLRDSAFTLETCYRTRDGEIFPVEITVNYIHYQEKEYFFVLSRDITERKRIEKEQENLRARLANAIEIAHLGPWEYDFATNLFTYNDQFYKMLRTTAEEMGGYFMSLAEYTRRFVHPDDMHHVGDETNRARETTDPHFDRQLEHRIIHADGTPGFMTIRFFVVKDDQGRTIKSYGVNQDITDRKRTEDERERLISELKAALSDVKTLSGLLPICTYCKKIRDDRGYWKQLEAYIQEHSKARFSHSLCRECAQKYYADFLDPVEE